MKGDGMPAYCPMLCILAAGIITVGAQPTSAQGYPTQTITFQVAFAAGGIADVVARLAGQKLSERLGYTVVVENRGGAGGNLAAKSVSGAASDGHSILVTTTSLAVNETTTRNKGFSVNDLRTIAIVAFSPDVAKVQAVHVPFTGGAPAVAAAIGNHVDAIVLTLPTVVPPITQGLLRGLGLASPGRNSAVPDVPTYGEMGFPDFYSGSWVGFFAPAKTPDAVVTKLNAEINAIMREQEAQQKLKTIGFDVIIKSAAEATDYFRSEVSRWGEMTRAIGYSSE